MDKNGENRGGWNKGKKYKNGPHKKKRRLYTEEEKQIASKRFKGVPKSEEHKLKIKNALTNNQKNLDHLKNIHERLLVTNVWLNRADIDITKIKNYQEEKEIYGHIYKTIFPNGKIYIGQCDRTINTTQEKSYFGSGTLFSRAKNKHGKQNLKKEILRLCYTLEEYNKWEHIYIKIYKADNRKIGYNILPGSANDWNGGLNPAKIPEVREKIRKAATGRIVSEQARRNRSIQQTGTRRNINTKKKMSDSMSGNRNCVDRVYSENTIKQMKISAKRGWEKRRNNKDRYRGVYKHKHGKWLMKITVEKMTYRMMFDTEIEAALAYNELAIFAYGEKAILNTITE